MGLILSQKFHYLKDTDFLVLAPERQRNDLKDTCVGLRRQGLYSTSRIFINILNYFAILSILSFEDKNKIVARRREI